ncbi:autotransporter-associated beta strand repeat-containing protein, partial [Rhodoligotrophos defluvii]|uniref:autotransporter-associated beta strand repeat-containing protein n=1 Tax=Rhodoligotrophos defluvii TaxID=2561934 RepID=UPI0014859D6D
MPVRFRRLAILSSSSVIALAAVAGPAIAATYTVTSASGDPTVENSLGWAIAQANANAGADEIVFDASLAGQTITLDKELPVIQDDVTIDGGGNVSVDGASRYRIFFVNSGNVTIANITLQNGRATGGNGGSSSTGGGGGGMGAGGAVFARSGSSVIIDSVTFSSNQAAGGNGGGKTGGSDSGGGGGGMGGHGGSNPGGSGGGGGFGVGANGGGSAPGSGGMDGLPGNLPGSGGASGTGGTVTPGNGGADGGGGGNASHGNTAGVSAVGGGGGQGAVGKDGGFGGGGGGAFARAAGHGGFGGGGGGAGGSGAVGGNGGFGGGGGRNGRPGGFGGGNGGASGGGGGGGLGGHLFVMDGATLQIRGATSIQGGQATGGAGGGGGGAGLGLGSGFYLHGETGLDIETEAGETITIADDIASDAYAPGYEDAEDPADPAGDGKDTGITKTGAGTLVLSGTNAYVGGTRIEDGTVSINNQASLGHSTSKVTMAGGTTLEATATFETAHDIELAGTVGTIDVTESNALTASGVISGAGKLEKEGTGTLVLTGINTYEGGTDIRDGTVSISNGSSLGAASGKVTMADGTTLEATATFETAHEIELAGTVGTIDVTDDNILTASGEIDGAGRLVKEGTGTLILSGDNTYTGDTTIAAGTLSVSSDGNLGTGGNVTIDDGAALQATGSFTSGRNVDLSGGTGTIEVTDSNRVEITGAVGGAGKLHKDGT